MSAIARCRSPGLGGHLLRCPACDHTQITYNSCRDRHCPKCQGSAARRWLDERQADLLPVDDYHLVFTLPAPVSDIAYYNKSVVYGLLFQAAAEALHPIAADPKHLGARIGVTLVLHTWGSAMTHHPPVQGIVPGGGLSLDGERWVACTPGFFLSVRVLSRLFRGLFLEKRCQAYPSGQLQFFGQHEALADATTFGEWLKPLRQCEWVVYAKRPFAGPAAVLAYLSRYTHRVAIANSRLIALDERGVTFKWKDYRAKKKDQYKTLTLAAGEFMRRFLLHVLPSGFHRIRHSGLTANARRKGNLARARELLGSETTEITLQRAEHETDSGEGDHPQRSDNTPFICPDCGGPRSSSPSLRAGNAPVRHPRSGGHHDRHRDQTPAKCTV